MPATLQQIQARLEQAEALRDELAQTAQELQLESLSSGVPSSTATQQSITARLNGYQREVEVRMKCERDLIANGRLDPEMERLAESRFNASEAVGAVITMPVLNDAQMAPREAPRSEASAKERYENRERLLSPSQLAGLDLLPAPLPAAEDVF